MGNDQGNETDERTSKGMMPCPHDHMLQESSSTLGGDCLRSSLRKRFWNYFFPSNLCMLELKINETEFMTSRI